MTFTPFEPYSQPKRRFHLTQAQLSLIFYIIGSLAFLTGSLLTLIRSL